MAMSLVCGGWPAIKRFQASWVSRMISSAYFWAVSGGGKSRRALFLASPEKANVFSGLPSASSVRPMLERRRTRDFVDLRGQLH